MEIRQGLKLRLGQYSEVYKMCLVGRKFGELTVIEKAGKSPKTKLIQTAALIAAFVVVLCLMPEQPRPPDTQGERIEALQVEVSQLREQGDRIEARLTEVYDQQSYEIMVRDWRGGK